jgi:quercetin dioxygenase-like cupin family protein
MRNFICIACAAAAIGGCAITAGLSYAAEPVKSQPTELMTTALTGDAGREVKIVNVMLPPGSDSGRHYHHGDQYTTVQEGEIHVAVDGSGEHVLKAGDVLISIP